MQGGFRVRKLMESGRGRRYAAECEDALEVRHPDDLALDDDLPSSALEREPLTSPEVEDGIVVLSLLHEENAIVAIGGRFEGALVTCLDPPEGIRFEESCDTSRLLVRNRSDDMKLSVGCAQNSLLSWAH